jgi:hypothetical protein
MRAFSRAGKFLRPPVAAPDFSRRGVLGSAGASPSRTFSSSVTRKRLAEKFVLAGRQNQRARRRRFPELAIASLTFMGYRALLLCID